MTTVPAPSLHHAREEWSDADFDLDDRPIHAVTDRDDDNEDWDAEMDLPKPARSAAPLDQLVASAPASSQMFIIRPSLPEIDDDDDEGVSTIKVAVLPRALPPKAPRSPIDEDFEDAFSLPSDLTQLSLAPLSLNHRVSKTSLEWGDRDQTSSSQSSDAYSSLGFADASPSSNSTSSVELPGTEDEDDDDDEEELEGLVIPVGIFESGKGARHLTKLLEMKKKAPVPEDKPRVSRPEEDDFETGLVIDDDYELSPSRLLTNQQLQSQRIFNVRSNSMPSSQRLSSLRPSSRLKLDRAKSPVAGRPPTRTQTSGPPPAPSSFLSPKPNNLRGQKSHSGLKPPTPPTTARKLTRKASLSSLMETSSNQASGSGSASAGTSKAGYEEPTAASRAKTFRYREFKVPPTRPSTPSSNPAALRLTMPTASRSKSRPALSAVFHGPSSASGSQSPSLFRSMSPIPPRPLSHLSTRPPSQPVASPPRPTAPRVLKRPKRQRLYGDGTELDAFDDLPTDRDKESRFRVQPKGYGNRVPGGSYPPKPEKGTMRRKRRDGSEGGSLDSHSPLGPSATNHTKQVSKSESQRFADPPKRKKQNSSPTAPGKKKPTLIRNLGGSGAPRVVGDMRWNPQSLRWEGNEQVLRDFDAAVGTSTRPALITHLTGSSIGSPVGSFANGARIVGNMIFDPARMCWISTLPPDEDEPDVFANLADDEDDEDGGSGWESKAGTIRASLQLASSSNSNASTATQLPSAAASPARSESSSYVRATSETSDSERGSRASVVFDVDDAFLESCRVAEERHRVEMKGWNVVSSRQDRTFQEPDRSHLYEIRDLATRQY
ncbi:hypothetical protein DFH08DRAFT_736663 [Mycena albidolilacea]|uniref:Protein byr4 n=1 Tax=Mycena albidolilacea TaxID=1033008 RepID=A0AAD7AFW3_9AGAR|nr:hypothetical protein DFH08DRAFT_736663 [Mycena albidolilacea]